MHRTLVALNSAAYHAYAIQYDQSQGVRRYFDDGSEVTPTAAAAQTLRGWLRVCNTRAL